ncbi:MAG: outer membrane beta-barrel protein [Pseudolabrys sp.]|nr:outer membrane beta-barrel protein [Pseudolabrys sp.]
MKKWLLLGFLLAAMNCAEPALAASPTWTGFYVGGSSGYAWGTQKSTTTIADGPGFLTCHFCDIFTGGNDTGVAANAGTQSLRPQGFTGGLQLGYNFQSGPWVYGIETDFGYFGQHRTNSTSVVLPANTALGGGGGVCGANATTTCVGNYSTTVSTDWLLTVRPRIGFAWDRTLAYATVGLAVTQLKFSHTYTDNITYFLIPGNTGAGGFVQMSASAVKVGFILGGGVEHSFAERWSVKGEYLVTRFSGLGANGVLTDGLTPTSGTFANFAANADHLTSHMLRVGLNYRFAD